MPRKPASLEDAFLQPIIANPNDDTPRLIFADWLEEQGNPRGTFIRLQCERAKLTQYHPQWKDLLAQESALLKQFEAEWSKPVLRHVDEVHFRRGFVEHVRVSASRLLKTADRLFRVAPVCSVRLEHADRLPEIAACAWLARVAELDLSRNPLGSKSLQALLRSEHCRSLRMLRLDQCGLYSATAQALAEVPNLNSLESLSMAGNDLGEDGVRALAHAARLSRLRELSLHGNQLSAAGARAFCSEPVFRLSKLLLGNNRIGSEGVAAIARGAQFADLAWLDLQANEVGNLGLEALVGSPYLWRLEHLNLANNHIGARGVQILTESPLLANLTYLNLKENEIDKPTLRTLPQRLQTSKIRELLF